MFSTNWTFEKSPLAFTVRGNGGSSGNGAIPRRRRRIWRHMAPPLSSSSTVLQGQDRGCTVVQYELYSGHSNPPKKEAEKITIKKCLDFPLLPKLKNFERDNSQRHFFLLFWEKLRMTRFFARYGGRRGIFFFYYFRGWQMMYVGEGAWVCGHRHTSLFGFYVHPREADELQRMISCDESLSPSFFGGRRERRKFLSRPPWNYFFSFPVFWWENGNFFP